jgi:hypothetical protein
MNSNVHRALDTLGIVTKDCWYRVHKCGRMVAANKVELEMLAISFPGPLLCGKTADYAKIIDHITTCRRSTHAKGCYDAMADKMAEDRQEVSSNSAPDASNGISNDEQGEEIWPCDDVVPEGGFVSV